MLREPVRDGDVLRAISSLRFKWTIRRNCKGPSKRCNLWQGAAQLEPLGEDGATVKFWATERESREYSVFFSHCFFSLRLSPGSSHWLNPLDPEKQESEWCSLLWSTSWGTEWFGEWWGIDLERQMGDIQQSHYCVCVFSIYTFCFYFQLPHVFVNCVECFTLRLLLEHILNKLNHLSSSEGECSAHINCETFNDFVRIFKQKITEAENLKDQTVYIVSNLISVYHVLLENWSVRSVSIFFEIRYVQCIVLGAYMI